MSGRFPEPGKTFEGKYRVETLLGSGGFARVYLAEQTDLGRPVAIKVLSPKIAQAVNAEATDPQVEAVAIRFEREARVISQLKSAKTITMYDYGRTESGLLYMVMEYVDGIELDDVDVPIAPRRVVKILKQMLQSLQEAHAHGLLHRDLKPANIMLYEHLGQQDQVKLLDFGIAKTVGQASKDTDKDLTAADTLIGTPRYMSPEQIRGEEVAPASDIYSLGLVVYELLVGEKAITNSDSIEILGRHLSADTFEIPRSHAIHPRLRRLVNKMLAKNTDERYATTSEVLEDLAEVEKIAGDLTNEAMPLPVGVEEFVDEEDGSIEELGAASSAPSGQKIVVLAAVLLVVVVAAVVAVWQLGDWQSDANEQPVAAVEDEPAEPEPAVAEEEPEKVVTLIRTRPKGASLWIDDRLEGMAPVELNSTDYEFPLTVRATIGDQSVEQTLEEPGGEIWMEFPQPEELADKQAEGDDEPAEPEPAPRKAERPTPTRVKKAKPKPAPAEPAPAPEEEAGGAEVAQAQGQQADEQPAREQQVQEDDPPDKEEDVDTRKYLPLD